MAATAQLTLFETTDRAITVVPVPHDLAERRPPTPEPARRRSQAWLALHFSELALAAAYHSAPSDRRATLDASAWAVIDDDRLKHVIACNEQAWQHGIRPGHRLNAAIALCGSLALVSRDAAAETRLLEQIASGCLKYTSTVTMQPPNEVLLEVRGSLRLFGGPSGLIKRIQSDLASIDAGLQLALAPTARSAQWLARGSTQPCLCLPRELSQALGSLPISTLQWPLPVELRLIRFGVTTVGDLMRLSRKDLARRIGAGPVRELQQAMGRTAWLHHGWATPPTYHDRILLDFEVETTGLLARLLERPLARLQRTLIGSARAVDELTIILKHRQASTRVALRLHQATADIVHISGLLHEHLERLVLPAPVREIAIDAPRLLVAHPRNHTLAMDPATRSDAAGTSELKARLLEQLQSRFGAKSVRALAVRAHHVPERAQHSDAPSHSTESSALPNHLPRRPLWLLREPKPVTAEYQRSEFQIESSPETIEAEAWDGPSVRRAYYRARMRGGVQCWLFRNLTAPHQWFIHGLYG